LAGYCINEGGMEERAGRPFRPLLREPFEFRRHALRMLGRVFGRRLTFRDFDFFDRVWFPQLRRDLRDGGLFGYGNYAGPRPATYHALLFGMITEYNLWSRAAPRWDRWDEY